MSARQRALVILLSLLVGMAGTALLLIAGSGSVGPLPEHSVKASGPKQPPLFAGEALISANGGFSDAEVRRIRGSVRVSAISAVRTGYLPVASGTAGYEVIPVETIAIEPTAYAPAVGRAGARLEAMLASGVVLSRSAASLRTLRVGQRLELTKRRVLEVTGVVDDHLLGGYEAAVSVERGERLGIARVAYALVRARGGLDTLKTSLRRLLGAKPLAFWLPGQRPWFRGGDGTHPLAQVKLRFGEFPEKPPTWASGPSRCSARSAATGWCSTTSRRPWPSWSGSASRVWSTSPPSSGSAAASGSASPTAAAASCRPAPGASGSTSPPAGPAPGSTAAWSTPWPGTASPGAAGG